MANRSDALLCERPHLWLDPTKLEIVSCCRAARAGEHGLEWSVGSRLIGFENDRNSLGETQLRTCLSAIPCPSVLPWIVCVHACQRNCWLFTARKPTVLHLSRQTLRHNKASSMTVLRSIRQLPIHHELPKKRRTRMGETMTARSQHRKR